MSEDKENVLVGVRWWANYIANDLLGPICIILALVFVAYSCVTSTTIKINCSEVSK